MKAPKIMTIAAVKKWWKNPEGGRYTDPLASVVDWLISEVEGLRGDVKASEAAFERMLSYNTARRVELEIEHERRVRAEKELCKADVGISNLRAEVDRMLSDNTALRSELLVESARRQRAEKELGHADIGLSHLSSVVAKLEESIRDAGESAKGSEPTMEEIQAWWTFDTRGNFPEPIDEKISWLIREVDRLSVLDSKREELLRQIGDFAHDASTGPAVPDALWEIRSMAYGGYLS